MSISVIEKAQRENGLLFVVFQINSDDTPFVAVIVQNSSVLQQLSQQFFFQKETLLGILKDNLWVPISPGNTVESAIVGLSIRLKEYETLVPKVDFNSTLTAVLGMLGSRVRMSQLEDFAFFETPQSFLKQYYSGQ